MDEPFTTRELAPSFLVSRGGDNGRRGRTLTGKGRHVCNTEVDGTARARAAAGLRGLRSSPSASVGGGGCGDGGR